MNVAAVERQKYERVWAMEEYRSACHSLALWRNRRELFPARFRSALDLGCGTGRLIAEWVADGVDARGVDIAANCLDSGADVADRVSIACLWEMEWPEGRVFDFAICTDVMEHIPPGHVTATLERIADCCDEVLFKIAHSPNQLGGEVLHLTLQPAAWWIEQMEAVGGVAEYLGYEVRSGNHDSLIRWHPRALLAEPACRGQLCLVVGSAPGAALPESSFDVVIGANGGAAIARAAGLDVRVLATTAHLFRNGLTAEEQATLDSLRDLSVEALWLDTKNAPAWEVAQRWPALGLSADRLCAVPPVLRERVATEAVGFSRWVSTGVWAACLALASGAKSVTLAGISGQARDHADQDAEVLAALEARGVEVLR